MARLTAQTFERSFACAFDRSGGTCSLSHLVYSSAATIRRFSARTSAGYPAAPLLSHSGGTSPSTKSHPRAIAPRPDFPGPGNVFDGMEHHTVKESHANPWREQPPFAVSYKATSCLLLRHRQDGSKIEAIRSQSRGSPCGIENARPFMRPIRRSMAPLTHFGDSRIEQENIYRARDSFRRNPHSEGDEMDGMTKLPCSRLNWKTEVRSLRHI
jgi:hypothetical protein